MRTHRRLQLLTFACLLGIAPFAHAQVYERIDVNDQGIPANAGAALTGEMSRDGRFVVFLTTATNLGGSLVAGTPDVFVRDRQLGTTQAITSSTNPTDPLTYRTVRISGDGTTVGYVRNGTGAADHPRSYVRDLASGVEAEVLVQGAADVVLLALDRTGRYALVSARTPPSFSRPVYRVEVATQAVVLCSRDMAGLPVDGGAADIDDDGTHVAFESNSSQVTPGDTNAVYDCFVYDIPGNIMIRASVTANGGSPSLQTRLPRITGNGRYVTMWSQSSNMVAGDTNGCPDVFVRDLRLAVTERVSLASNSAQLATGAYGEASFSSEDASSITFLSNQLVHAGDSPSIDVFLRDRNLDTLHAVSPGDPIPVADNYLLGITADGRTVLFATHQQAILTPFVGPGVFVAKFGPRCSSSGYCSSLPNSTGASATIGAQGDASRTLNNLVISGVGLPDTAIAMLVSGTSAVDPGTPFGNGLMCIGGALIRHGIHVANGGVILDHQDMNSPEYAGVNPGDTRYYQIVYRDPAAGGANFNTTDAVSVTFCW